MRRPIAAILPGRRAVIANCFFRETLLLLRNILTAGFLLASETGCGHATFLRHDVYFFATNGQPPSASGRKASSPGTVASTL